MLFVFALGNIIYNIENLYLGGEDVPEFYAGSSEQSGDFAASSTVVNAIRWVYYGFLGFIILTFIIGGFSFSKSKDKKKWRNLFYQMIGALAICGIIVGFGYFYDDIESTITGGGESIILEEGGGEAGTEDPNAVPDTPDGIEVLAKFGMFAFFFAFWAIAFITIARFAKHRSTKLDYSDIDLQTQEVADTIQRTIDALADGSDTRATVIRCYTDMCKVMAKYGVVEEEHLTPREFEKLAKDSLPVPDELIHDLVVIFEEARYSDHDMTDEDSKRALSALEGMKGKLLELKTDDDNTEKEVETDGR